MFDRQGMDDSRHSVRSVESTSDNFFSTAPWEAIAPAATCAALTHVTFHVIEGDGARQATLLPQNKAEASVIENRMASSC